MNINEIEHLSAEERDLLVLAIGKSATGFAIWQSPQPHDLSAELTLRYINFLGARPSGKHPRELIEKSMKESFPELVGTELDRGLHEAIHLQSDLDVVVHTFPQGASIQRSFRNHLTPISADVVLAAFSEITREVMLEREYKIERRTNLTSRAYFDDLFYENFESLKKAKDGETLGFIFFDLDNFKAINDNYGHVSGDLVLSEVARRLCTIQPAPLAISHWGGDEFAIITNFSIEENEKFVQEILKALSAPYRLNDVDIHLSTSIGYRTISSSQRISRGELFTSVDKAMYLAKGRGGAQSQIAE